MCVSTYVCVCMCVCVYTSICMYVCTHIRSTHTQHKHTHIYMGALMFNNGNPKETFCYNVNRDIMNNNFTLYVDDNHRPSNDLINYNKITIVLMRMI